MFIGHYSIAFLLKKYDKKLNLGFLFIAAQLLDFAGFFFVIFGIEHMRFVPGFTETNSLEVLFAPYSHSPLAAGIWAIGTYLVVRYLFLKNSDESEVNKSKTALALGIAVFVHILLDLLVHVEELTLIPGTDYKVKGLGLWDYLFIGLALELSVLLIGCFFYFKSTTSEDNFISKYGMLLFTIFLVFLAILTPFLPDQTDMISFLIFGLIIFTLFSLIAFWLDRKRIPVDMVNS